MDVPLSNSELDRYHRQIMISGWGEEGQLLLKSAKVVVVGLGGLGCPVSLYLAAAGVGNLVLVDKETFELSNLNRQVLGWEKDIGRHKVEVAREKLNGFNPAISVTEKITEVTMHNVDNIIDGATVVVDALDNWDTRFIVNDACVRSKIPFVHAGIIGLSGQITTIIPGEGPCLKCIIPEEPEPVTTFPVLGATPGLFGTLQVIETLKLITGIGETLKGRLIYFDGEFMDFDSVEIGRNPNCPTCSSL
ncbi:MAG: HesA/MoeB/ThiF family protein [Candidatus Thorarchaeota archaeon]|nr:MAG: HesA/MoeB/ThiF family protein [Candidatus Thorarchaeota archaeon]